MATGDLRSTYIYDLVLRFIHAAMATTTLFLIATGLYAANVEPGSDQAALWMLHTKAGIILTMSFVGRLIWGLIGPRWARWVELWHGREWLELLRRKSYTFDASRHGHDPFASIAYLGFYFLLIVMITSGWSLSGMMHNVGPMAEALFDDLENQFQIHEVHEWGFWLIGIFVIVHLSAMALHEKIHGLPIAQSMISGYQFRRRKGNNDDLH